MTLARWPYFDSSDIQACHDVLLSGKVNYWTGQHCHLFEKEFSGYMDSSFALAMANGSLALSASYLSLNISSGDEVITTPRSFIATASSIALLQAKPIFADVDPDSGCISVETIAPLITPRTKAISVVHLAGWPADMPAICDLARSHNISVVEDCAQAHGAYIVVEGKKRSVGSFGDVSAWSFCTDKIISTGGEGGMVTTSNPDIYDHIWSLKDHGKSRRKCQIKDPSSGFRWLHDSFGSNFRLTEMQSAIGRNQLLKLPSWTAERANNAMLMIKTLSKHSCVRVPIPPDAFKHAFYKLYAYIVPGSLKSDWSRDRIVNEIGKAGYPGLTGSCSEIYLERCFRQSSFRPSNRLRIAKLLGETSLMFLVHPTITASQMSAYCESVSTILARATR